MAWQYRGALADPLGSPFGILLSLKIALALACWRMCSPR